MVNPPLTDEAATCTIINYGIFLANSSWGTTNNFRFVIQTQIFVFSLKYF